MFVECVCVEKSASLEMNNKSFAYFQEQSKPFDAKKNVWVPDKEEGFLASEIKSTKGDNVTVITSKGTEVSALVPVLL